MGDKRPLVPGLLPERCTTEASGAGLERADLARLSPPRRGNPARTCMGQRFRPLIVKRHPLTKCIPTVRRDRS